jgi:hypothetical protein
MKNSAASTGEAASRPPSLLTEVVPPTRSTRPTVRNSVVCTMMWCTM